MLFIQAARISMQHIWNTFWGFFGQFGMRGTNIVMEEELSQVWKRLRFERAYRIIEEYKVQIPIPKAVTAAPIVKWAGPDPYSFRLNVDASIHKNGTVGDKGLHGITSSCRKEMGRRQPVHHQS